MKTTIKGNYSFRKPSKQKISKLPAIIGLILIFLSFVAGTQYFAWDIGKNRLPNELFSYAGIKIYFPTEILEWLKLWKKTHRNMKDFTDSLIVIGGCAFIGVALIAVTIRDKNSKQDAANLYGSAQYAELDEIREAGLLPQKGENGAGVYVGGWNIKAYLICQDKAQLDAAYGKDESITSNCHVTIAYAPNKVDTAKYLSDRLGVTTVIKEQESISFQGGTGIFAKKSVTKSQQEVQRAVLTPDEIMRLPGPVKDVNQNIVEPGDMLIFSAGFPPIYGKQILYFLDKVFSERSKIDAPEKSDVIEQKT